MDLATIIGIASGFLILIIAIASRPGAMMFLEPASLAIVLGGTIAATLVTYPLKDVMGAMKVANKAFLHKAKPVHDIISKLVDLSRKARVEGLLALEKDINEIDDEFIQKGLQLMVDGTETEVLRDIMSTELENLEDRHTSGQGIFKTMGIYSPAFGMAGTLIGLIQMLSQLDDPSKIGAGMATALITTLYGVVFANLLFLPIAGKLKLRSQAEVVTKELTIEGICSIQAGDNPRLLRDKLVTFVAPNLREVEAEEV